MSLLRFPYTDLHTLNLDWLIEQLNQEGAVLSVNDKHGIVVLTGEDIKRNISTPETVSQALTSQGTAIQTVRTQIGTTPLPTTAQSLTGAIAENAEEIADLQDDVIGSTPLPTAAQTLTGAIAENTEEISDIEDNVIGNTPLGTTANTLTGAIAEHELDIQTLITQITRTNVGVTLNATGNQYFNHVATHGNKQLGVYSVGINVTTIAEVPANSELNIGTVSINPTWTATGYVVVNNTSLLVGGVQISASGGIYIRLNDSVPAGRDLIIFAMTNYY